MAVGWDLFEQLSKRVRALWSRPTGRPLPVVIREYEEMEEEMTVLDKMRMNG